MCALQRRRLLVSTTARASVTGAGTLSPLTLLGDSTHQAQALGGESRGSAFLDATQWSSIGRVLRLSPRALEISQCVVDGYSEVDIAARLGISGHTVHTYIERLYRKLAVHDRCQLVTRLFAAYVALQADDREPAFAG